MPENKDITSEVLKDFISRVYQTSDKERSLIDITNKFFTDNAIKILEAIKVIEEIPKPSFAQRVESQITTSKYPNRNMRFYSYDYYFAQERNIDKNLSGNLVSDGMRLILTDIPFFMRNEFKQRLEYQLKRISKYPAVDRFKTEIPKVDLHINNATYLDLLSKEEKRDNAEYLRQNGDKNYHNHADRTQRSRQRI